MAERIALANLTPASYAPYGDVVDWTPELIEEAGGRPFHIAVRSEAPTGWRLALSNVTARVAERMAYHPDTIEMFAPTSGQAVLLVAAPGPFDEGAIHAFALDRPVTVNPGVWHATIALSSSATLLIAENLDVSSVTETLLAPLGAAVGP